MGVLGLSQVRKGAWTREEDLLLTNCVQANGEGNWHLVPAKAGLNRCRKSCRLRWLNYLKPNLKRGVFEEDEVDLLLKLHKLLGNRWAMIAKRLPGRTGNDVKNYWNTHLAKKQQASKTSSSSWRRNNNKAAAASNNNVVRVQPIRPKPRSFKNGLWHVRQPIISQLPPQPPPPPPAPENNATTTMSWWETLLLTDNNNNEEEGGDEVAAGAIGNTNTKLASTNFEDDSLIMTPSSSSEESIWEKLLATHHDDTWQHLINSSLFC